MALLDSIPCVVEETENNGPNRNGPLEPLKYRFDQILLINDRSTYLRGREYKL